MPKVKLNQIDSIHINDVNNLNDELVRAQTKNQIYTNALAIEKEIVAQWNTSSYPPDLQVGHGVSGTAGMRELLLKYDSDRLGECLFLQVYSGTEGQDILYKVAEDLRFPTVADLNDYMESLRAEEVNHVGYTFSLYKKVVKNIQQTIVPYNLAYSMIIGRKNLGTSTTSFNYLIEDHYHNPASSTIQKLIKDVYAMYSYTVEETQEDMMQAVMSFTKKASHQTAYNLTPNSLENSVYIHDEQGHQNRTWFDTVSKTFVPWIEDLVIDYGKSWFWTCPLSDRQSQLWGTPDYTIQSFMGEQSFVKIQELRTIIEGNPCVHFRVSPVGYDTIVINGFADPLVEEHMQSTLYNVYMMHQDNTSCKKLSLMDYDITATEPRRKFYRIMPEVWKSKLPKAYRLSRQTQKKLKFFITNQETGISFPYLATIQLRYKCRGALIKPMIINK